MHLLGSITFYIPSDYNFNGLFLFIITMHLITIKQFNGDFIFVYIRLFVYLIFVNFFKANFISSSTKDELKTLKERFESNTVL